MSNRYMHIEYKFIHMNPEEATTSVKSTVEEAPPAPPSQPEQKTEVQAKLAEVVEQEKEDESH